jgi:site-specific recombinase XerC
VSAHAGGAVTADRLLLADASRMIRDALRDRSYRATPLGLEVASYYRWKKNEWGATADTLRDYEAILARLALFFADLELRDLAPPVGTERLRECWDYHWGDRSARTRAKVRSVWVDFFEWAMRERGLVGNPARQLASPKKRETRVETFTPTFVEQVIGAQTYPADIIGCALILRYGLRKGGLRNIQRKHFDFERRLLEVQTKGGRVHTLPIVDEWIWRRLGELELESGWQPDHFLLYRIDSRKMRVDLDQAEEVIQLGKGERVGYANVKRRLHDRQLGQHGAHDWWYRCLATAGVVADDVTRGMNMHRGRHTAITDLLRSSHDLKLAQLLAGHKDIRTTARYAQLDVGDLEQAMRAMAERAEED